MMPSAMSMAGLKSWENHLQFRQGFYRFSSTALESQSSSSKSTPGYWLRCSWPMTEPIVANTILTVILNRNAIRKANRIRNGLPNVLEGRIVNRMPNRITSRIVLFLFVNKYKLYRNMSFIDFASEKSQLCYFFGSKSGMLRWKIGVWPQYQHFSYRIQFCAKPV